MTSTPAPAVAGLPIPVDRDAFLRTLIGDLAEVLQDVVGLEDARGFVSLVGRRTGERLDADYRAALGTDRLSPAQVAEVLVDLKARIQGRFRIVEADATRIVFGNSACPFGDRVRGRPALCMMTSNVFGTIAADNLGYAKVELRETIGGGGSGCRVVVHLAPTEAAAAATGHEYFGGA
jgi:predicted ArsR family transcriptional regulator